MVNPVKYHLSTTRGDRSITIEPVYEEIAGGDLFSTGRYLLTENDGTVGEIRFDGELFEWEWTGDENPGNDSIFQVVNFIREYNEPELAGYLD